MNKGNLLPDNFTGSNYKLIVANNETAITLAKWSKNKKHTGEFKYLPTESIDELVLKYLNTENKKYYCIFDKELNIPIGRFYFTMWEFQPNKLDIELNRMIAISDYRGIGIGTNIAKEVSNRLLKHEKINSVFLYNWNTNKIAIKSAQKAGFRIQGYLPSDYYKVTELPKKKCVLLTKFK